MCVSGHVGDLLELHLGDLDEILGRNPQSCFCLLSPAASGQNKRICESPASLDSTSRKEGPTWAEMTAFKPSGLGSLMVRPAHAPFWDVSYI